LITVDFYRCIWGIGGSKPWPPVVNESNFTPFPYIAPMSFASGAARIFPCLPLQYSRKTRIYGIVGKWGKKKKEEKKCPEKNLFALTGI